MKFKPQLVDKVHAIYFIYNLFWPNENLRHKKTKTFFDCQNHLIEHPPKKIVPNLRVQPLILSMEFIFPLIWMLGFAFSIYEMTMRFKVHHADKKGWCKNQKVMYYRHMLFVREDIHIKYLCAMIFRQKQIYLKRRWNFMLEWWHFLIMWKKHHQCVMYNLYNSDAFSKAAYNHEKNYWIVVLRGK